MTRRKTDGERITDLLSSFRGFKPLSLSQLRGRIDRAIRRRQREAWDEGWYCRAGDNPYKGRKKK